MPHVKGFSSLVRMGSNLCHSIIKTRCTAHILCNVLNLCTLWGVFFFFQFSCPWRSRLVNCLQLGTEMNIGVEAKKVSCYLYKDAVDWSRFLGLPSKYYNSEPFILLWILRNNIKSGKKNATKVSNLWQSLMFIVT